MKSHLKKVQDHAESCQYSSMPGGQADCTTCRKWQDLKRIKEQWRRKLIEQYKLTQKDRPAPSAAAGGYGQAASVAVAPHLRGAVPMSAFGQPTVGGAPLHAAPSVSLPGRGRGAVALVRGDLQRLVAVVAREVERQLPDGVHDVHPRTALQQQLEGGERRRLGGRVDEGSLVASVLEVDEVREDAQPAEHGRLLAVEQPRQPRQLLG